MSGPNNDTDTTVLSSSAFQREGVSVSVKNLKYSIVKSHSCKGGKPDTVDILNGTCMHVSAGQLFAIMGPSGSGKSTLLNVIAKRATTRNTIMSGDIYFGGAPKDKDVASFSNYVMQRDALFECLTVEETLKLAAALRMRSYTRSQRHERVEAVLTELGLQECRKVYVGGEMKKGISGGQKKRVAIAIELLDDPSLLFLDEPTSGLDSALAYDLLEHLKHLADNGRTIVCTVHQPRSQVFSMFENLLLLSGGYTVYHGSTEGVCDYFERISYKCPAHFNPADFILDLLSKKSAPKKIDKPHKTLSQLKAGDVNIEIEKAPSKSLTEEHECNDETNENRVKSFHSEATLPPVEDVKDSPSNNGRTYISAEMISDLPTRFQESPEYQFVLDSLDKDRGDKAVEKNPLANNLLATVGNLFKSDVRYKGNNALLDWFRTTFLLTYRAALNSLRHPMTGFLTIVVDVGMGLLFGGIWFDVGNKSYLDGTTAQEQRVRDQVQGILGILFFLTVNIPFSAFNMLSAFQHERAIFNREVLSKIYTPSSFFISKSIADLPFQHFPATLLMLIVYFMATLPLTAGQFFIFVLIGNINVFASVGFFYLASALLPNVELANLLAPVWVVINMLIAGFFLKDPQIPGWIGWLKHISWIRYIFFASAIDIFPSGEKWGIWNNDVLLKDWSGIEADRLWVNIGLAFTVGVVFRFLAYLAVKYCNRRVGIEG